MDPAFLIITDISEHFSHPQQHHFQSGLAGRFEFFPVIAMNENPHESPLILLHRFHSLYHQHLSRFFIKSFYHGSGFTQLSILLVFDNIANYICARS